MNDEVIARLCSINPESLGPATSPNFTFDYIDISSVTLGQIAWREIRRMEYRDAPSRARRRARVGDVLLCTVRPSLKSHARIASENGTPQVGSTGFAVLRPRIPSDSSYVYHQLFSDCIAAQLRAMETGSNYPAVNERDVSRLHFYAPDADERQRIAAVLDAVDAAAAKTGAMIGKLKQVRSGLLHDLLTRGLDDNGELRDPFKHPEKFQDSPLGTIPNNWEIVPVETVGQVRLGRQRSPSQEVGQHIRPYLRVANVFDGYIDYSDVLVMNFEPAEQATYGLRSGDILLNEGQSLELVGRSAIFTGPNDTYCFQNTLIRFRCYEGAIAEFCQAVFKYWLDTRRFTQIAKQTTSVAHLGADRFAQMPFPRPTKTEQIEIARRLQLQAERQMNEEDTLLKLRHLKSGLMSDLLTGRVRVPETISTEPTA